MGSGFSGIPLGQSLEILAMKNAVKTGYMKLAKHLPERFRENVETSSLNPIRLLDRLRIHQSLRSGPPYRPSHRKIILDITASCDLHCVDCNRSCGEGQALSNEHMSVVQIEKFIGESIGQGRRWEEIVLEGGEPTLHPNLPEIIELLLRYKKTFSPRTTVQLLTNGYGNQSRTCGEYLRQRDILVVNTRKTSRVQPHHCAFNIAPCDMPEMGSIDFSQGCFLPACYGLGLTRHGYYPHPICGGIDRVFGFGIGRKKLPAPTDSMQDQFARLCALCGYFRHSFLSNARHADHASRDDARSGISVSWKAAYSRYQKEVPMLELY